MLFIYIDKILGNYHCVKSVCIWSFYGPYFPTFGLNTERYSVSHRIQFEYRKMRTRKTLKSNTFLTVYYLLCVIEIYKILNLKERPSFRIDHVTILKLKFVVLKLYVASALQFLSVYNASETGNRTSVGWFTFRKKFHVGKQNTLIIKTIF